MIVGGEDGGVAAWDVGGARRIGASQQHAGAVWALSVSRGDGALLASGARYKFGGHFSDDLACCRIGASQQHAEVVWAPSVSHGDVALLASGAPVFDSSD